MAKGTVLLKTDGAAVVLAEDGSDVGADALDGRTFQIHAVAPGLLRLHPVVIEDVVMRCPVVIGGERCGKRSGHDGKHCWAGGD